MPGVSYRLGHDQKVSGSMSTLISGASGIQYPTKYKVGVSCEQKGI